MRRFDERPYARTTVHSKRNTCDAKQCNMMGATPVWEPNFHKNFVRIALDCIDAAARESRRMFQHFRDLQDLNSFAPLETRKFRKSSSICS